MRRAYRRPLSGSWALNLRDGSRLELPRSSMMTWSVAVDGVYDNHVVNALAPHIRPGSAVLDVGASLGLWTVQLANIARRRDAVVHCFEPNPANLPWLYRNVELNDLQDTVTIHDIGLGEADTGVAFGGIERGGVGNGWLLPPGTTATSEQTVALRRLDGLSFDRPVSLIKLDVEGYEPSVLRGATALIERDRPVIFGEFSQRYLDLRGEDVESAVALIGYEAFRLNTRRSRFWRPADQITIDPLPRPLSHVDDLLLMPPA
jgi:FkbM family methyltransferase